MFQKNHHSNANFCNHSIRHVQNTSQTFKMELLTKKVHSSKLMTSLQTIPSQTSHQAPDMAIRKKCDSNLYNKITL